jgi:peptidoglycan hydrolase CwlO-like protein
MEPDNPIPVKEIEPGVQNDQTDSEWSPKSFFKNIFLLILVTLLPAMFVACMASIFMDRIGHNRLLFVMVFAFLIYYFIQSVAYTKLHSQYIFSIDWVVQLLATKNELSRTNEELSRTNEELSRTNEELSRTNEELSKTSEELSKTNEELSRTNEELSKTSEELSRTNEELLTQTLMRLDTSKAYLGVYTDLAEVKAELEKTQDTLKKLKETNEKSHKELLDTKEELSETYRELHDTITMLTEVESAAAKMVEEAVIKMIDTHTGYMAWREPDRCV